MTYHPAILFAVIGVCLAAISAWMHIKNHEGYWWTLLATLFLITSCAKA